MLRLLVFVKTQGKSSATATDQSPHLTSATYGALHVDISLVAYFYYVHIAKREPPVCLASHSKKSDISSFLEILVSDVVPGTKSHVCT